MDKHSEHQEAHKLARILFGLIEGGGPCEGIDIYADSFQADDGDVFVHRAGELLIEQAAEINELVRYVDAFGSQLAARPARASQAPAPSIGDVRDPLLKWALRELLGALPKNRDWFNPDAEKVLLAVVAGQSAPSPATPSVTFVGGSGHTVATGYKSLSGEITAAPSPALGPLVGCSDGNTRVVLGVPYAKPKAAPSTAASIDTPEFRALVDAYVRFFMTDEPGEIGEQYWAAIRTHIDAHCARLASQSASAKDAADDRSMSAWLSNEDVAELWRASGHSGVVPFSFANRMQERLLAARAAMTRAER